MIDQMYGQNRLKYPLKAIIKLTLPRFLNTRPEVGKSRPNSNLVYGMTLTGMTHTV